MKKILVTSTDLMMIQFLVPHVLYLREQGFDVEVACSDVGGRLDEVKEKLGVETVHSVHLVRSPANLTNLNGLRELKQIIDFGHYELIWTNEPVMGIMTRLAAQKARKSSTKVLYMVHGFHFFKGAPLINWLLYYPIERIMANKADVICTVNQEDYHRAKGFKVKRVEYIHGVGIDPERYGNAENGKCLRGELGLKDDELIVLSVGELNKNKNQKVIIQALSLLKDPKIHYVLCGKGNQAETLRNLAQEYGLQANVHFLGYRKDILNIYKQADIYVMPSFREGLPVSSLEAMYCGLPLITSNIRGLSDIMEDGKTGYAVAPENKNAFAEKIVFLKDNPLLREEMSKNNQEAVYPFMVNQTKIEIASLIRSLI